MRLMEKGHKLGLLPDDTYERFREKKGQIEEEISRIKKTRIKPRVINEALEKLGTSTIDEDITLQQLLKRPEVSYSLIKEYSPSEKTLGEDAARQVEILIKYEGYIIRQLETAERIIRLEGRRIPEEIDYNAIQGLSKEILSKLDEIRPGSLGQAGRIQGMTPAALSLIMVAAEKMRRTKAKTAKK